MFQKAFFKELGIRNCSVRLNRLIKPKPQQLLSDSQQLNIIANQKRQNDEQLPNIFRLHFYSFESVFDYLSLQDVVAVGLTCERLLQFAQGYFKIAFQSTEVLCGINGLFVRNVRVDNFVEQVKNIGIWLRGINTIETMNLVSVEKINLHHVRIAPFVLPTSFAQSIKMIELHNCTTSDDFHDSFLKVFENLERLYIKSDTNTNSIIGTANSWLFNTYLKLECFGLEMGVHASQMDDLLVFLSRNPQITNLLINSRIFSANCEAFLKSTIKLKVLKIKFDPWATIHNDRVKKLLNDAFKLEKQKFYEKISLIFDHCHVDSCVTEQLALLNLTELRIDQSSLIFDKNILAERLVQLEKLFFHFAFCDDILPFIRLSKKLSDLTTKFLGEGEYLQNDVLDLIGLSSTRREIGSKLTLFVGEDIYVSTKNGTKYSSSLLIELKRVESKLG